MSRNNIKDAIRLYWESLSISFILFKLVLERGYRGTTTLLYEFVTVITGSWLGLLL